MIQHYATKILDTEVESAPSDLRGAVLCGVYLGSFIGTLTVECRPDVSADWVAFQDLTGAVQDSYFPLAPADTLGLSQIRIVSDTNQVADIDFVFAARID